jgi:transcriptional regulator with XRE-family HTH domain
MHEQGLQIGLRVRDIRIARGLTQKDLSEKTGISPSSISKLEKLSRDLTTDQVVDVARALDVTVAELFGEKPPVEAQIARLSREAIEVARQWDGFSHEQKLALSVVFKSFMQNT